MTLHDVVADLGEDTGEQVLAMWRRWQHGQITETEFRNLTESVLVRAGARSAALADVALTAALTAMNTAVAAPVGLEAPADAPAAARAAVDETLTSESYNRDAAAAVGVLGSAFALETFQRSYSEGMRSQGVQYWERVPNDGACEVCIDLSEGVVSSDIPMWHHKGCQCVARPIN